MTRATHWGILLALLVGCEAGPDSLTAESGGVDQLGPARPEPASPAVPAPLLGWALPEPSVPASSGAPSAEQAGTAHLTGARSTGTLAHLTVRHAMRSPARVARGPAGRLYVTDPKVGSLFVLDAQLQPVAEISGLRHPLGVTVGPGGRIFVGEAGRGRVALFDAEGRAAGALGEDRLVMPNDLALDERGNLYVADSQRNRVDVFDPSGRLLATLGEALRFPAAVAVSQRELFVANQGLGRIEVYALGDLSWLRSLGHKLEVADEAWQGAFVRLQGLDLDPAGRLHAVDAFLSRVQVLDPLEGAFLGAYGEYGWGPGQLRVPLDVIAGAAGGAIVVSGENHRLERFSPRQVTP